MKLSSILSSLLFISLPYSNSAHVTANPKEALEGSYFVATFRIPHGCGNSSTVEIVIDYDEEALKTSSFTPQYVAGWKTSIKKKANNATIETSSSTTTNGTSTNSSSTNTTAPVVSEIGSGEESVGVVYTGGELPSELYGDFGISFKLPNISALPADRNGTLYFPVYQKCKNGEWQNWTAIGDKKYPPPKIVLLSANGTSSSKAKSSAAFFKNISSMALLLPALAAFYY